MKNETTERIEWERNTENIAKMKSNEQKNKKIYIKINRKVWHI